MADDIEPRILHWLTLCKAPEQDPLQGMAEAGLFATPPDYATIARLKAAFVHHTGLLGVGGIGGGRHLVGRHFIEGFGTAEQKATWLGRAISVAISEPDVGAHPKLRASALRRPALCDTDHVWLGSAGRCPAVRQSVHRYILAAN